MKEYLRWYNPDLKLQMIQLRPREIKVIFPKSQLVPKMPQSVSAPCAQQHLEGSARIEGKRNYRLDDGKYKKAAREW